MLVLELMCWLSQVTRNCQGEQAIQEGESDMALTEAEAAITSAFQELLLQGDGSLQPAAASQPELPWLLEVGGAQW
jgi:hypothetical protein